MLANSIDFDSPTCSACSKPSIDIRTEVLLPTDKDRKENRIRKVIIFRCENHLAYDAEEMVRLSNTRLKNNQN
jgi:hypothetical protein